MKLIFNPISLTAVYLLSAFSSSLSASTKIEYSYNSEGQLEQVDGPRTDINDTKNITYDSMGNISSISNALGHTVTFPTYSQSGRLIQQIDENGVSTTFEYDKRGRKTLEILSAEISGNTVLNSTQYHYDKIGQLTHIVYANGEEQIFEYDDARRLKSAQDALGNKMEFTRDNHGNILESLYKNTSGVTTYTRSYSYDEFGNLVSIDQQGINKAEFAYDLEGNLVNFIDGNDNQKQYSLNAHGEKTTLVDALGNTASWSYDIKGRVSEIIDPSGNKTTFQYDHLGNITRTVSPDSGEIVQTYDNAGNRKTTAQPNGSITQYFYDELNRLINIDYQNDGSNEVTFEYDNGEFGVGNLTAIIEDSVSQIIGYDFEGRITESSINIENNTFTTNYSYDEKGRLKRISYPSGRTVDYELNLSGQVTRLTTSKDGAVKTVASEIVNLPFGPITQNTLGNGIQVSKGYDLSYRLNQNDHLSILSKSYLYDGNDNLTSISDNLISSKNESFSFDELNRLVGASGDYGSQSFSYGASGNRLEFNRDSYVYESGSNRLVENSDWLFTYNERGDVLSKLVNDGSGDGYLFAYNENGRLEEVTLRSTVKEGKGKGSTSTQSDTLIASYTYNSFGQRVLKKSYNGDKYFIYDSRGQLIAEADSTGSPVREYIYLEGRPLAVIEYSLEENTPNTVETTFDNLSPSTQSTGTWEPLVDRKNLQYADNYLLAAGGTNSHFEWIITLPDGEYEVYAQWVANRKNSSNTEFSIIHAGETERVYVDQTANGSTWVSLGSFNFSSASSNSISISDINGQAVADAIKLVKTEVSQPPEIVDRLYFSHNNHLGAPVAITDEAGQIVWSGTYEPFGNVNVETESLVNNIRFPGQYYDEESDLHYNYYRDYDPTLGRYLQSDPIGILRDYSDPRMQVAIQTGIPIQSIAGAINHLYGYAEQNPLSMIDPYGLWSFGLKGTGTFHDGVLGGTVSSGPSIGTDEKGDFKVCWQTTTCANTGIGMSTGSGASLSCSLDGNLSDGDSVASGLFGQVGNGRVSHTANGDSSTTTFAFLPLGTGASGGAATCLTRTSCW